LFIVPASNQSGSSTITLTATDPDGGRTTRSFVLTITPVNDPPVVANVEPTSLEYIAGGGPKTLSSTVSVTDLDSTQLTGATIQFVVGYIKSEDQLEFADQGPIQGTFETDTGVLTLTGLDTPENYQTALRSITYRNSNGNPNLLPRSVSVSVTDDGALDSLALTREISVTRGNTPLSISGLPLALRVNQDATTGPIAVTLGGPDSPLTELAVTATSSDAVLVPNANITIGGSGVDRVLEITPAAHRTGATTITVSATDGVAVASSRFDLIVNAIPTLNELLDHIMMENGSAIIPLTIGDEETSAADLLRPVRIGLGRPPSRSRSVRGPRLRRVRLF
jgi:hypothetical protein